MSPVLTKGTGNQARNRDKALEVALSIYMGSCKIDGSRSNISIAGNIYRVAAYADPKSKFALVDDVDSQTKNQFPIWYQDDISGVILVKQTADNRLLFFVIDKEPLFSYLQNSSVNKVSIDWAAVNKIKNKELTKIYKAPINQDV